MSRPERRWWRVAKRLVTLAMFAVPWYLRDGEAVELDKSVIVAQEVLAEKDAALQRQEQDEIQREMVRTLARIEGRMEASSPEQVEQQARESLATTVQEEAEALRKNVDTFTSLMKRVSIDKGLDLTTWQKKLDEWLEKNDANARGPLPLCQALCMSDIVKEAEAVAAVMESSEFQTSATPEQNKEVSTRYWTVRELLSIAYDQLSSEADADRDEAAQDADGARATAWLFTALGGLLLGDWKKLFAGSDAESQETA
jgi:hypothetical protein